MRYGVNFAKKLTQFSYSSSFTSALQLPSTQENQAIK